MRVLFLKLFVSIILFFSLSNLAFAKYPKHSFMPMLGLANTGISDFSLRVSHNLQVSYTSGDRIRTPLGLRYQYRMKKGNIFGVDIQSIYNPLIILPQYIDANSNFGGPAMAAGTNMIGGNFHYSKTIDIKLLEVFGMAGIGGYLTGIGAKDNSTDFLWYKNADPEFYDFAPVVTNNSLNAFMPVVVFGAGVRFRHLEAGLHNQFSISSPVQNFTYNGYTHTVPLHWKSIGYYVGYRIEF